MASLLSLTQQPLQKIGEYIRFVKSGDEKLEGVSLLGLIKKIRLFNDLLRGHERRFGDCLACALEIRLYNIPPGARETC